MDDCYSHRFPDGPRVHHLDDGVEHEGHDRQAHMAGCVACVAEVDLCGAEGRLDSRHETERCRKDYFGPAGPDNWRKSLGLAWHCPSRRHQNRRIG